MYQMCKAPVPVNHLKSNRKLDNQSYATKKCVLFYKIIINQMRGDKSAKEKGKNQEVGFLYHFVFKRVEFKLSFKRRAGFWPQRLLMVAYHMNTKERACFGFVTPPRSGETRTCSFIYTTNIFSPLPWSRHCFEC